MRGSTQIETYSFQKFDLNRDLKRNFVFIKCIDHSQAASWVSAKYKQAFSSRGHWKVDWRDHLYSCFSKIKKHNIQRRKFTVHLLRQR